MLKILALILSLSLCSFTYAEGIFLESPEDAFALSEETKLDVLLVFTADWCPNCIQMKKDIIENISVVDNYIVCYVDYDKRADMVKEYKVKRIPDYMIYKNKKEIKRKVGYNGINQFKNWLTTPNK